MIIQVKSCEECISKASACDVWTNHSETTLSGWNKNRFAICCEEYKIKEGEGIRNERV